MKSNHTKGKWIVVNSGGAITAEQKDGYKVICTLETVPLKISPEVQANAERIAMCCNTHDELVKCLEDVF